MLFNLLYLMKKATKPVYKKLLTQAHFHVLELVKQRLSQKAPY